MKAQIVAPSWASEPSEPSEIRPGKKTREQLQEGQEENPQLMAHIPGWQSGDAKATKAGRSKGEKGGRVTWQSRVLRG